MSGSDIVVHLWNNYSEVALTCQILKHTTANSVEAEKPPSSVFSNENAKKLC